MSRDDEVLAALYRAKAGRPAEVARLLNLGRACGWCLVGPPRAKEQCATVPPSSARRVARVLDRLVRRGRAEKMWHGTRMVTYMPVYEPTGVT